MNARLLPGCVAVLALLSAVAARAADGKKDDEQVVLGQPPPMTFNEIERGLWISLEAAPILHMEWLSTLPPTHLPRQLLPDDAGPGIRTGWRVGYDVMGRFSVDGYLMGQFREMRIRRGRSYTGDIGDLDFGVGVRLMPVPLMENRLFFTGRVALGGALLAPGEVARANANPGCILPPPEDGVDGINPMCVALPGVETPDNRLGFHPFPAKTFAVSPSGEVTAGVEYFTKLRHFSVGVELAAGTVLYPFSLHVGVVPHVKYTF